MSLRNPFDWSLDQRVKVTVVEPMSDLSNSSSLSPVKETSLNGAITCQRRWVVLAWLTIACCFYVPSASAEKVVVSYPSRSLTSFLIPEIAREVFFSEGIEANLIYVREAST